MRPGMFVCLTVLGAVYASASTARAQDEVYTAKMVRMKGLSMESVQVDLRVRQRSTQDQADALLEILNESGSDALKDALLKGDFGEARVTGGLLRRLVWVRVFPGQNGSSIMMVTDKPIYFPSDDITQEARTDALGVIQLELNDRGQGQGRLGQAVRVHVTDEGVLRIESAHPDSIEIEDVRRQQ